MKNLAIAVLALMSVPASAAEPLKVTASFSILADMVREVGGSRVEVTSLVGPGEDAHAFSPAPTHAAMVAKADVILINGLGFEGWMERLVQSANAKGLVVTATKGVKTIEPAEDGHDHGHDHGDDHGDEVDPHAWQDARNGIVYAVNIAEGLCNVDSVNCAEYRANAAAYSTKLEAVDDEIRAAFAAIPEEGRKVITSHDAFGYFEAAYGVEFMAAHGVSEKSEASAKDIAKLIQQIKKEKVRALFVENISDPRLIEQIATNAGIQPSGEIYSDALSPAGGPAATYIDMMRFNAHALAAAMR